MTCCLFVSDLHGKSHRYEKLFELIASQEPDAVFMGGDILPSPLLGLSAPSSYHIDFINSFLVPRFQKLKASLGNRYPSIYIILGNDDGRMEEATLLDGATRGLWNYAHGTSLPLGIWTVYGYSYVPPTPFRLKDWERYDVSRFVDPGCVSPEEGAHSFPVSPNELRYSTIQQDLTLLCGLDDLSHGIFLFHTPPYQTSLDRAALDGKLVDHVPLDVHVGSIAVKRFIQQRQPLLTLHGHIHESARLTGAWSQRLGRTHMMGAAHDGEELAVVIFELENLDGARRLLL